MAMICTQCGTIRDGAFEEFPGSVTLEVGIAERTLATVFKKSGVKDPHAHRYRHTLAKRLLEQGTTFEQVTDILGNSPAVFRKHYGKWSKGRQANIDWLMMAPFRTAGVHKLSHTRIKRKNGAVN